jgi:hypothetical protein
MWRGYGLADFAQHRTILGSVDVDRWSAIAGCGGL